MNRTASLSGTLATAFAALLVAGLPSCTNAPAEPPGPAGQPDTTTFVDAGGDVDTSARPNDPPGPLEMHLEPAEPTTSDDLVIVIDADSIDPDGQPVSLSYAVRWYRDDLLTPNSGLTLPSQQTRRGETWRVEIAGWDGQDEGPMQEATVTIGNSPPTLAFVSLKPTEPTTDDVLTCDPGTVDDADGDDVSLTYAWFKDDQPISGATSAGLQPPHDAGSTYQCSARPFDGQVEGDVKGSNIVTPTLFVTSESLISTFPNSLDLGTVVPGQTNEAQLTISNIGEAPLLISSGTLEGDPGFIFDTSVFPASVLPGGKMVITVGFATDTPGLQKGSLVLDNNSQNKPIRSIPLLGIGASPCLAVDPPVLDFGGAYPPANVNLPVTIRSCGDLPVTVESIDLLNPDGAPFQLNAAPLPQPPPFTLQPTEEAFFNIAFTPAVASAVDADGLPIPETATVAIGTNAPKPIKEVPIQGFAAPGGCPIAIPTVVEGGIVTPNSTITLSANQSFGAFGVPSLVSWGAASLPNGETAQAFLPAADAHEVTYDVGGPGTYTFELRVFDQANEDGLACGDAGNPCTQVIPGCTPGFVSVEVKDAIPLIFELVWDTPGDPNQSDTGAGKGADLDLHVHNGTGTKDDYDQDGVADSWFDILADCYWLDSSPDWGAPGPDDDPLLSQEDADGQGPERIEYANPVPGSTYTLGAHYWSDYEFGSSVVTMRIYLFEELAWEVTDIVLESGDLFEAATVTWPDLLVTPSFGSEGGPKITPEYPNPFFQ